MFLQRTKETTDEEYQIILDATTSLEDLKKWRILEKRRSINIEAIKRALLLKFPLLTSVSIADNAIQLQTELHSQAFWSWDKSVSEPVFKCDIQVKDMPDNAEDYLKMRANIMEDKRQIMTAMNYIYFRFDIKAR